MTATAFETIAVDMADGVATVTLSRPQALNAFSMTMQRELALLIPRLADDATVRAVVLTGAGRAFCAGGDIREMDTLEDRSPLAARGRLQRMLATVLMPLVRLPKPVVAAVNGPAFGAGMNLALAADVVYAADTASFSQAFVKVGLVPDTGGLYLLTRLVGLQVAKDLCFTGRSVSADEAAALGLVGRVVPAAALMAAAREKALQFAQGATAAIGLTKTLLHLATDSTLEQMAEHEAAALAIALSTHDHREGIRAFIEKRTPQFCGH